MSRRAPGLAQLVEHLTLAQVMISRLVGSSPTSGFVLAAQSSFRFRLALSLSLPHSLSLSEIKH